MQTLILATLFPTQQIYLLEKRKEHVRNHGLRIWNTTIESIQEILTSIQKRVNSILGQKNKEDSLYYQQVVNNIDNTKCFLKKNFLDAPGFMGPFISTKKISIMLQEFAISIGEKNQKDLKLKENKVMLKQGKQYEFKFEYLDTNDISEDIEKVEKKETLEEVIYVENSKFMEKIEENSEDELDVTEVKEIIKNSSIIFSAEGSHSIIRKFIIGEEFPKETVIQYLIEIKIHLKPDIEPRNIDDENVEPIASSSIQSKKKKRKSLDLMSSSSVDSDNNFSSVINSTEFVGESVNKMISPLITTGKVHVWNKGKDGTATLHILVEKDVFDAMTSKINSKGNMGGFANPYTRLRQLPYAADTRKLIKNGLSDVIGLENFDHDSLKITTIPMKIYFSKELMKIQNEKLFVLVGDAACGLIFIEGANNAIHTGVNYGRGLMSFFLNQEMTPDHLTTLKFVDTIPKELMTASQKIKKRYDEAENRIKWKKKAIDVGESLAYTSTMISSTKKRHEKTYHEMDKVSKFYDYFVNIDDALDDIAVDKTFSSAIHLFDAFVDEIEQEANHIEENDKNTVPEKNLKKLLVETLSFLNYLLSNDNENIVERIQQFHKESIELTMRNSVTLLIFSNQVESSITEKMNELITYLLKLFEN